MKRKTLKAVQGSVSLLLVLILIPMMTLSAVIVDTSRINMARSMVSSAGDLAMNTALANYDTILKDVYGLFAMSQGKTDQEMANAIKQYFQETLVSYGVVNEAQSGEYVEALIGDFTKIVGDVSEVDVQNLMEMEIKNFSIARQADSALSNPNVLRKQIVEYMKYRAPINLGMSFLDSLKSFKSVEKQNEVVETQVKAQESTQDVTAACKKLIKLIREFDDLIESIEEGDKLVKGSAHSTDGVAVQLADYPTQVDKYASTWGQENSPENYTHTNKINLVFLAKAPSSNVYLKNLGVAKFITKDSTTGNYSIILEKTGISGVDASTLDLDTAESKAKEQINLLNCTNGEPYREQMESYAAFGISLDVLDPTNNYTALKYFVDEPAAISYYNQYVAFLQNINQDVKYSDIQAALRQILILGQYYARYETLIDGEISNAYNLYDQAKRKVEGIQRDAMSNSTSIYNAARDINDLMQAFVESEAYGEIDSIPEHAMNAVYGLYDEVNPQLNYNYSGYYNNNYKDSPNDADDVFVKGLKDIGNNTAYKGKAKNIASAVKSYYSEGKTESLLTYVTNKVKNASDNPLYELVKVLYKSHQKAKEVPGFIKAYDEAMGKLPGAIQDRDTKKQTYEDWKNRKAGVVQLMNTCLSWYKPYVDVYQDDVIVYDKYMTTAQNIVTRETGAINTQFTKIKTNLNDIIKKLTAIEDQIGVAESAISTYDSNVNKWEEANNKYQNSNQKDSFSKQNAADIAASREQYDKESLALLLASVTAVKTSYNDLYTRLTDATHYKYGTSKIDTITDHNGTKSAVSSAAAGWTELVISAEFANGKFASLYNTEATPALEPDFWYFLRPVRPIQILKYLNETYPDEETLSEEQKTKNEQTKTDYEDAKSDLVGEASSIKDETPASKYGYSYKDQTVSKTGLPSVDHAASGSGGKEFKAKADAEDPDKVDTSSAMEGQKSALSSVLSGIDKVISTGVENLYILTYLFENFSYNTIVQDQVIKNADINGKPGALTLATSELGKAESISTVTDNMRMLSNFPMNATHNRYFGGEIEYVLYGNASMNSNVTYTKASIYALRFGFNCIYAFTDSTIRTMTMSAGLSVQAATLGVVPYQLVQIVLQLALAAAESAIDLQMMNSGLKVAVIKSKQTWAMSMKNISANAKAIAEVATTELTEAAQNAIMNVTNGLQNIVDAGVDELNGAIADLQSSLPAAAQSAANEVVDAATSHIIESVENVINQLQYMEVETKDQVKTYLKGALDNVKTGLSDELYALFPGNEIAEKMIPYIITALETPWATMESEMLGMIDAIDMTGEVTDLTSQVVSKITEMKIKLVNSVADIAETATGYVANVAFEATQSVRDQLNGYIGQAGEQLSEEAAKAIKDSVTQITNSFLDTTLNAGGNVIGGGLDNINGTSTSSVASIISFGYKDYLMLFCFIQICATPDVTLTRMADLIQLNINHASTTDGATYKHANYMNGGKSSFYMKHAWTYLTLSADVELEMLFMNLDIFANLVASDETTVDGAFSQNATITYNGLLGY